QLAALLRVLVGKKLAGLFGAGNHADDVEVSAAKKGCVAGRLGGRDLEIPELGEDVAIDEIVARNVGDRPFLQDYAEPGSPHPSGAARDNSRLPAAQRRDHAAGSDRDNGIVIGLELDEASDVALGAVGIARGDEDL